MHIVYICIHELFACQEPLASADEVRQMAENAKRMRVRSVNNLYVSLLNVLTLIFHLFEGECEKSPRCHWSPKYSITDISPTTTTPLPNTHTHTHTHNRDGVLVITSPQNLLSLRSHWKQLCGTPQTF